MLSFSQLSKTNAARCEASFHGIDRWTPTDWATAMAGECGEACNEIKKLRRLETNPDWARQDPDSRTPEAITARIGMELADLIIYADLLATRLGINLAAAVAEKFNQVSEEIGAPQRLSQGLAGNMELAITATEHTTRLDGVECRLWEGSTVDGTPCRVFIHRIAVHNDYDHEAFQQQLAEKLPPGRFIPLSMIL